MIVKGIDVGQKGGLATIAGDMVAVCPMPDDSRALVALLKGSSHVFIEKAQSMPKMGVAAMFNYGKGAGTIEGILIALGIPFTLVGPKVWMKVMHAGTDSSMGTKERSLQACYRLFPSVSLKPTLRCRKDSDGMAEALLIAEYGRRVLTGKLDM